MDNETCKKNINNRTYIYKYICIYVYILEIILYKIAKSQGKGIFLFNKI